MNILCKWFGHKPPVYGPKGWWSPGEEYGRLRNLITDGCGRVHAIVTGECARCGEKFDMARVHLPREEDVK